MKGPGRRSGLCARLTTRSSQEIPEITVFVMYLDPKEPTFFGFLNMSSLYESLKKRRLLGV